ncbi:MAG: molybdenum ABC transporter ATP-binding protein [Pseudomonadales bacterium]|nr:molybdenum ABC transporter ATP-binding protein [Pseudomonadales bacterium]
MSIEARFNVRRSAFNLCIDLQLASQGVTVFYGPSGSGKTTLLRCIAGLERAAEGRLYVHGERWQEDDYFLPVHARALGYVFQEAHLFTHLSVEGNLNYALRRNPQAPRMDHTRREVIELLGINHLMQRHPNKLSGGERQRVAIARALLSSPRLLLMDEPLAALDRERKREILPYLERLRDELDIPILYVSHSMDEVSRLADHVVLLDQGQVIANGTLSEVTSLINLPLAQDPQAAVVIETSVADHDNHYHLMRLDFADGCIHTGLLNLALGTRVRVAIHARDVSIALTPSLDSSLLNRLAAVVENHAPAQHPSQILVQLRAGNTSILARISRRSFDELQLHPGQQVWAHIKTVALVE